MKRVLIFILALTLILVAGCKTKDKLKNGDDDDNISPTDSNNDDDDGTGLKDTVSKEIKELTKDKPHKFVTFSFDDGTVQDARLAALFDKYGIKCTFNVNTGSVGQPGTLKLDQGTVNFTKLTEEEMREAYKNHEVAVHTVNHPNLLDCSNERIITEVNDDKANIERIMQQKVVGMAYPGGPFFDDRVIDVILSNTEIRYSRETTGSNKFDMPTNFMIWKPSAHYRQASYLITKFIKLEPTEDSLLYIWGHSWELDLYNDWDNFEKMLKKLAESDDIIFVTNSEIYYYMNN